MEHSINKALKQVDFNSNHSGNGSGSEGESSARSDINFHKCGQEGHIKKDCGSNRNGSGGNPPNNSTNELPYVVKDSLLLRQLPLGPYHRTEKLNKVSLVWTCF